MDKALEHHHLSADDAGEVIARLASFLAFTFDFADVKATSDQLTQVDASDNDLAPRVALLERDALLGVLAFDGLSLNQRDIACFRVVEVAITLEPTPGMSCNCVDGMGRLAVFARQIDRFDSAHLVAHPGPKCYPSSERLSLDGYG